MTDQNVQVEIINNAIIRLKQYGWTRLEYVNKNGQCCMIGALDGWDYPDEDSHSEPTIDTGESADIKIALADRIRSDYPDLYKQILHIVEGDMEEVGSTSSYLDWAEAVIFNFNDHPDIQLQDVIYILEEYLNDIA